MEWYLKAAQAKHVPAMAALGQLFDEGKIVKKDSVKAADWFLKAARAGDKYSMEFIAWCYREGEGSNKIWMNRFAVSQGAEAGRPSAMSTLASFYASGKGVAKDEALALKWLRKAADLGDLSAIKSLGEMYEQGVGVPKDTKEAFRLFRKAAEQDDPWGISMLACAYRDGTGVDIDHKEAVLLFRHAAEKQYPPRWLASVMLMKLARGSSRMVKLHCNGIERPPISMMEPARVFWADVIERGSVLISITKKLSSGFNGARSLAISKQPNISLIAILRVPGRSRQDKGYCLASRTHREGDKSSMVKLGYCYFEGAGVEQDEKEAFNWYRKGAEAGDATAMYYLGWMYENGKAVPEDFDAAVKWYAKAAKLGSTQAKERLNELQ